MREPRCLQIYHSEEERKRRRGRKEKGEECRQQERREGEQRTEWVSDRQKETRMLSEMFIRTFGGVLKSLSVVLLSLSFWEFGGIILKLHILQQKQDLGIISLQYLTCLFILSTE